MFYRGTLAEKKMDKFNAIIMMTRSAFIFAETLDQTTLSSSKILGCCFFVINMRLSFWWFCQSSHTRIRACTHARMHAQTYTHPWKSTADRSTVIDYISQ